jgi:hypothetical protein
VGVCPPAKNRTEHSFSCFRESFVSYMDQKRARICHIVGEKLNRYDRMAMSPAALRRRTLGESRAVSNSRNGEIPQRLLERRMCSAGLEGRHTLPKLFWLSTPSAHCSCSTRTSTSKRNAHPSPTWRYRRGKMLTVYPVFLSRLCTYHRNSPRSIL